MCGSDGIDPRAPRARLIDQPGCRPKSSDSQSAPDITRATRRKVAISAESHDLPRRARVAGAGAGRCSRTVELSESAANCRPFRRPRRQGTRQRLDMPRELAACCESVQRIPRGVIVCACRATARRGRAGRRRPAAARAVGRDRAPPAPPLSALAAPPSPRCRGSARFSDADRGARRRPRSAAPQRARDDDAPRRAGREHDAATGSAR